MFTVMSYKQRVVDLSPFLFFIMAMNAESDSDASNEDR